MQYKYTSRCAAGYVEFKRGDEVVRLHIGEPTEVPKWLEGKLRNNNHFEAVSPDQEIAELMAEGEADDEAAPVRRPGRPRKQQ